MVSSGEYPIITKCMNGELVVLPSYGGSLYSSSSSASSVSSSSSSSSWSSSSSCYLDCDPALSSSYTVTLSGGTGAWAWKNGSHTVSSGAVGRCLYSDGLGLEVVIQWNPDSGKWEGLVLSMGVLCGYAVYTGSSDMCSPTGAYSLTSCPEGDEGECAGDTCPTFIVT